MNFEILADGNLIYCSGEIGSRGAAIIDISIPAGTKLLTLRGMSFDGYNDDSFAFADAKVWKEDGAKTVTVKSVSLREITVSYTAAAADGQGYGRHIPCRRNRSGRDRKPCGGRRRGKDQPCRTHKRRSRKARQKKSSTL